MAQRKPQWRNRITGYGEEAPDQLLANPGNWRTHPANQQDALSGVLSEVGIVQNVIVNQRTGYLVDGHLRVMLAMRNEQPTIPVTYVDLSEAEEAEILATLDPIAALAAADAAKLGELLESVSSGDAAVQQMLSDLAEREGVLDALGGTQGLTDPDDVPKPPVDPITQPGDLWLLGRHRLLCGDSTNSLQVHRLLSGTRPELCMTDPPYGADIQYATHDDTQGALVELIAGFLPIARMYCRTVALTPGINNVFHYPRPDWMLCWFYGAGTGRSPWGFTAWQPFLVYGADPKLAAGEGCHPDGFQFMMTKDDAAENRELDHACPKPFSVWERFMERLSNKHTKAVYDPFSGSGTTFVAAEKLGIVAYGAEISPAYCDVIVRRWEQFTGETASRERVEAMAAD